MAQLVYTDPGSMNKLIDFWDQPRDPNADGSSPGAVLFIAGVPAKIATAWSVTQAKRLPQQVLAESTHQIIILYRPGLRQRMFVLLNDPDYDAPRRFDIDRIADPDEQKHELQILATERNT
jgi:hypothetical protein